MAGKLNRLVDDAPEIEAEGVEGETLSKTFLEEIVLVPLAHPQPTRSPSGREGVLTPLCRVESMGGWWSVPPTRKRQGIVRTNAIFRPCVGLSGSSCSRVPTSSMPGTTVCGTTTLVVFFVVIPVGVSIAKYHLKSWVKGSGRD